MPSSAPIGVFDSGIGGLSVLRHIRAQLPHESLLYFADSGFAPYGDKPEPVIVERTLAIADFLLQQGVKALVVACNTATAAAIKALRAHYPALAVVGVEPGLKPAVALTRSKIVGVLATDNTLKSAKFAQLRAQISADSGVRFLPQACIGLVDQIEKGELHSADTALLVQRYVAPLIAQGADTLVLGCTHYPFVQGLIDAVVSRSSEQPVSVIDTGQSVARHLARLLAEHGLLSATATEGSLQAFTTGSHGALAHAFTQLLQLRPPVMQIAAETPIAAAV
ncbi:glutamate racemase [Undibacterium arcticum]|uniref:Glutamate racemase n=1 Tax=Undibacterium arcticum TaxID=1762892 RepID=A0ABV7F9J7_9BURK